MRQPLAGAVQLVAPGPPPYGGPSRHQARADEEAVMGGPGSGRRSDKRCVTECRVLSVGELAGLGRREKHPTGEIIWVAARSQIAQARLLYTISEEHWPQGPDLWVLALRYWPKLHAPRVASASSSARSPAWPAVPAAMSRCASSTPRPAPSTSSVGPATIWSTAGDPGPTASPSCRSPWVLCWRVSMQPTP